MDEGGLLLGDQVYGRLKELLILQADPYIFDRQVLRPRVRQCVQSVAPCVQPSFQCVEHSCVVPGNRAIHRKLLDEGGLFLGEQVYGLVNDRPGGLLILQAARQHGGTA